MRSLRPTLVITVAVLLMGTLAVFLRQAEHGFARGEVGTAVSAVTAIVLLTMTVASYIVERRWT